MIFQFQLFNYKINIKKQYFKIFNRVQTAIMIYINSE